MNLHTISVSNYRSITSAKKIRLDRTTVLIGPNNEGKSNILRALVLAMRILTRGRMIYGSRRQIGYSVQGYDWEMDFPIGKQKSKPNGETEIILEFMLDRDEYTEFQSEIKSKITGLLPLKLSIGKKGVKIAFHKKGKGAVGLTKKSRSIANFVSDRIEFEHIPAVRTAASALDVVEDLVGRELSVLEDNEEYQRALQSIAELQKPILDELAGNLKGTLKKFLPKVRDVCIDLPTEQRIRAFRRGVNISINDGNLTPLQYKGDGVQSLSALAMIRHSSIRSGKGKNFVIAIEEPESHLHPKAIHELKEVIDELGEEHQVLITSHNPLFVDRRVLASNIVVNQNKARPAKSVAEIRGVLGVRASDNLRNAEMVLVVEGEDDVSSIRSLICEKSEYLSACLDNGTLAFDSLGGGANLSYKLSLLRDSICLYHVFLDWDKCGKDAYRKAKQSGLLEDAHFVYAKAAGRNESELEDLLNVSLYKEPLERKYGVSLTTRQFRSKKKWSERIKDTFSAFGKPWDSTVKNSVKNMVAELVKENPENAVSPQNSDIIGGLVASLEYRVKEKEKAQQDAIGNS